MATNWSGFFAELAQNAGAALPHVLPLPNGKGGGGIWELNEIERANQKRVLNFPYLAYGVTAAPSGEWGLTNSAYEVKVEFYLIDQEPSGLSLVPGLAALRDQLDLLRARILHQGNFATATVLDVDQLDWTMQNPAMSVFIDRGLPFICAALSAVFIIGETIS